MTKADQTALRGLHVVVVEDDDDARFIVEALTGRRSVDEVS
jgi:hypothetical protein